MNPGSSTAAFPAGQPESPGSEPSPEPSPDPGLYAVLTLEPGCFSPSPARPDAGFDAAALVLACRAAAIGSLLVICRNADGDPRGPSGHFADPIRELEQACRRHQLAFGLQLSGCGN